MDLSQKNPPTITSISNFLRLLQQIITKTLARFEPMVDCSQSQILTRDVHVQTLQAITQKKVEVAIKKKFKYKKNL